MVPGTRIEPFLCDLWVPLICPAYQHATTSPWCKKTVLVAWIPNLKDEKQKSVRVWKREEKRDPIPAHAKAWSRGISKGLALLHPANDLNFSLSLQSHSGSKTKTRTKEDYRMKLVLSLCVVLPCCFLFKPKWTQVIGKRTRRTFCTQEEEEETEQSGVPPPPDSLCICFLLGNRKH